MTILTVGQGGVGMSRLRTFAAWSLLCSAMVSAGPVPVTVSRQSGDNYQLRAGTFALQRQSAAGIKNARAIGFPDSPTIVQLWNEGDHSCYAISLDGHSAQTVRQAQYEILLNYAQFDPLKSEPPISTSLRSLPDARVFVVQFWTQPLEEYRAELEAHGITIHHYLGNYAYIVSADFQLRSVLSQLPFVRWTGELHPAYRVEEFIRINLLDRPVGGPALRYNIMMLEPGPQMKNVLGNFILAIGGKIDCNGPDGFLIQASLTEEQLLKVISRDEVLYVDRWLPTVEYMDNVRIVGGANYLESVAGFTGQGVRAEVMDSNLRSTHQAFAALPPIFHGNHGGSDSHGTSVYGILFGNGAGNSAGRGMIPDAQGIFADFEFITPGNTRYQMIGQLKQAPYFAVFQTNSWGSCCTTAYGAPAADMDLTLFDHDILLLQAQANSGQFSDTRSDAIAFAKNLVSVGGIHHQNTASLTDDFWFNPSGCASVGPASDGRIKPDLSFWYDSILTTSNSSDTSYTTSFCCTSAATPMTAGHFGLFFQMWSEGIFGNLVTPGGTVFDNRPHMSTSKAMMINSCTPYPFTGAAADLTRVHQGWGRPDVARLYNLRNKMFIINETDLLTNLQSRTYLVNVAPSEPEFRATLVYTDRPGVPNSAQHRINDLTLKVTAPDSTVYWGNNGMTSGNVTTPGGSPNTKDTVENVWLLNPSSGIWSVEVIGAEIPADSHVETPEIDADYALVVSGIVPIVPTGDLNCDGAVDGDDIAAFALGILNLSGYEATYPTCNVRYGDFDLNAQLTPGDVDGFVNVLLAP